MTDREINQNFIKNLLKLQNDNNLTQSEMAQILDISSTAYKKLISGEVQKISIAYEARLHKRFGVWLFEMIDENIPMANSIRMMKSMNDHQIKFIESLIAFEYRLAHKSTITGMDYLTCFVPTGNLEDGMIYDSSNIEIIDITGIKPKYPGRLISCGIKITSNHLHPVYHIDDILLVELKPPRHNDVGIFIDKNNGLLYIRTFLQGDPCELRPLNGYGEPIFVNPYDSTDMNRWKKFGRVVTKLRQ